MTPTLTALQQFNTKSQGSEGTLSDVGMILIQPPERAWFDDTPNNGHIFAHTGGDGVHFCLLENSGQLTDESPVVMVVPCNHDAPRLVVGDTLHDFLSLGSTIGFFFLEKLVYDLDETLVYLFDYDAFIRHIYFVEKPPEEDLDELAAEREILRALAKEFDLCPWEDPRAKLGALQKKWSPIIELRS